MKHEGELLTERAAARLAAVGRGTIRRHRALGNITPLTLGTAIFYPLPVLETWLARFKAGEFRPQKEKRN